MSFRPPDLVPKEAAIERIVVMPPELAAKLADYAAAYGDKSADAAIDILAEFFDRLEART